MNFYDVPDLPGVPPLLRTAGALASSAARVAAVLRRPTLGALPGAVRSAQFLADTVTGNVSTLLGQSDDFYSADASQGRWGLYDQAGNLVITPDAFMGLEFRSSTRLSNYPLEEGAFETYNKVNDPFDLVVGMACGGSNAARSEFLARAAEIANSLELYTLVTPDEVFPSVNIERYDYSRKRQDGAGLVIVNFFLKEVRVVEDTATATSAEDAVPIEAAAAATTPATVAGSVRSFRLDAVNVVNAASASLKSIGQVQAVAATVAQSARALSGFAKSGKLPIGCTQNFSTGVVYGPNGRVDVESTIAVGSAFLGVR